jgi:hypothetical protein
VMDSRTSHTCANLNDEVFKTEDATEGENYPPMHPHCRSTTVPYEYADIESDSVNETSKEESQNDESDGVFAKSNLSADVKNAIEKEFGKLNSSEVILRDERLEHIRERHPEIVDVLKDNYIETVNNPDYALKDYKNTDTALFLKKIEDYSINLVVKLSASNSDKSLENSTITVYRVRKREVKRLQKKNKIIFDKKDKKR